jgi:hypothetical protein
MKILIEKRQVEVLIPAAIGRNSRLIGEACLGQEVDVPETDYSRWRAAVMAYARAQKEMDGVVGGQHAKNL